MPEDWEKVIGICPCDKEIVEFFKSSQVSNPVPA